MRIKICLPHYLEAYHPAARACAVALRCAGVPCDLYGCRGTIISHSRNRLMTAGEDEQGDIYLTPDKAYTHFLCVDDDILYTPEQIIALIDTGYPVVSAAYTQRGNPFYFSAGIETDAPFVYKPLRVADTGVVKVGYTGAGCLLIQSDVLMHMAHKGALPWFRFLDFAIDGRMVSLGEDIGFCRNVYASGLAVHLASNIRVWHTANHEPSPVTLTLADIAQEGFPAAWVRLCGYSGLSPEDKRNLDAAGKWILKVGSTKHWPGDTPDRSLPFHLPMTRRIPVSDKYLTDSEAHILSSVITLEG